ncbi:hypothetical protein IFM89_036590 [Coptis chinensis]|uniref:F-box domain-containing protein n=1 Tax=Coptis chinensis TaxID=261450 RepID=A0A835HJ57_9MAGN|nr:hypothetical protein IFM89_036590 [Coptis chinensis]
MDAKTDKPASELKELSEEQSVSEGKDRFSSLPSTLLQYILSFIPTKEVVATSILSTRWKYLWTSHPNLIFDEGIADEDPVEKKKFVDFVDWVLTLHDESNIKTLSITCKDPDQSRIDAWISAAVQHKVQELNLDVNVKECLSFVLLPELVCRSDSLSILELQSNLGIVIATPFSLPNLKILHLHSVLYSSTLPKKAKEPLLLNCPVLSELILENCEMPDFESIIISLPSLESFILLDTYRDSEMKIFAENLVHFVYKGGLSNELSLCSTPSLVDAYIEVNTEYTPEDFSLYASKLFRQLSKVKFLAVTNVTISTLSRFENFHATLPIFQNLIHFELSTEVALGDTRLLMALLKNSPNVEHLLFEKDIFPKFHIDGDRVMPQSVPTSFPLRLKSVTFDEFGASKIELFLVKNLLENAMALERMTIFSSEKFAEAREKQVMLWNYLSKARKGSKCCLIDFF